MDQSIFERILNSFDEVRSLYESGHVKHPFSMKEALTVARHHDMFPKDDVSTVLHDVLDYDSYDPEQYQYYVPLFDSFGFPIPPYDEWKEKLWHSINSGRVQYEYTHRNVEPDPSIPFSTTIGKVLCFFFLRMTLLCCC